jgi:hypothetical protein
MPAYDFAINVRTQYLPEQSKPERTLHVFTYTITIKNTGDVPAQLISRHWVITDANGKSRKCAAWAWSATSRCSSRARSSNTPAAPSWKRPRAR